jgi:hypothetical protein
LISCIIYLIPAIFIQLITDREHQDGRGHHPDRHDQLDGADFREAKSEAR